ncbi:MAG: hypothetical protein BJG00_000745 [Limnothrix sp. CACIAM 69d]|nr:MAG: hypothetical protein BJG00_000745 [Limnothrix sp. CACIAM 69d]
MSVIGGLTNSILIEIQVCFRLVSSNFQSLILIDNTDFEKPKTRDGSPQLELINVWSIVN